MTQTAFTIESNLVTSEFIREFQIFTKQEVANFIFYGSDSILADKIYAMTVVEGCVFTPVDESYP